MLFSSIGSMGLLIMLEGILLNNGNNGDFESLGRSHCGT